MRRGYINSILQRFFKGTQEIEVEHSKSFICVVTDFVFGSEVFTVSHKNTSCKMFIHYDYRNVQKNMIWSNPSLALA